MGFELNSLEPVDESFMPLNLFNPFEEVPTPASNPCIALVSAV
jgi:hypothetical protein